MLKKIILPILFIVAFASCSAEKNTAPDGWVDNIETAVAKAEKEDKLILINFTGSDWCSWCKKLWGEVFSQKEFKDYAKKNLVLLYVDFPRYSELSKEIERKNNILQGIFGVRGFPSIYLFKSDMTPVLFTGYQAGGAEAYVKHLTKDRLIDSVQERDGKSAEQQIEEYREQVVKLLNEEFSLGLK